MQPLTPAGYRLPLGAPPGLLQFLVGIQANESGFDYFRAQGSPSGSVQDPSTSIGGGYGAYQFQEGTDQYNQASATGWDPYTQDKLAAQLATGYYHEFGPLAQQTGTNIWQYVAEAWYGPGTVPQNPVAANSVADVQNVLAAESGRPNLPPAWQYGGFKGLSAPQVRTELAGHPYTGKVQLTGATPPPWDLKTFLQKHGHPGLFPGFADLNPVPGWLGDIGHVLFRVALVIVGFVLLAYGLHGAFEGSGETPTGAPRAEEATAAEAS